MGKEGEQGDGRITRGPGRIQTQIHRRSKAKAASPLKSEWERRDGTPPDHLKMPSDRMGKHTSNPLKNKAV